MNKALASTFGMAFAACAFAQSPQLETPEAIQEVSFQQKLNEQVPLDLAFRNDEGLAVKLSDYFGDKPVVLSLVYYECPMLCTLVLNGVLQSYSELPFTAGKEFTSLTISFDHEETHVLAAGKKKTYLEEYGREGAAGGWHFLVGEEEPIQKLSEAVGFSFKYVPESDEYAHRSGIVVLTPEGKVSRYFPGTEYDPTDLRLGLVEASKGGIGGLVDRLFLLCYHYDPAIGQYSVAINNVINIACGLTVLIVGGALVFFFRRERSSKTAIPIPS